MVFDIKKHMCETSSYNQIVENACNKNQSKKSNQGINIKEQRSTCIIERVSAVFDPSNLGMQWVIERTES